MKKILFLFLLVFSLFKVTLAQEELFYLDTNRFEILVEYNYSIEEIAIKDSHNFASFHINSKNFPKLENRDSEELISPRIIKFEKAIKTEDLLFILEENYFRPANIFELLAFSKKYKNYQLMFPIVSLGSSFFGDKGRPLVPIISVNILKRGVYTVFSDKVWSNNYGFLVVPIKKTEASLLR